MFLHWREIFKSIGIKDLFKCFTMPSFVYSVFEGNKGVRDSDDLNLRTIGYNLKGNRKICELLSNNKRVQNSRYKLKIK